MGHHYDDVALIVGAVVAALSVFPGKPEYAGIAALVAGLKFVLSELQDRKKVTPT